MKISITYLFFYKYKKMLESNEPINNEYIKSHTNDLMIQYSYLQYLYNSDEDITCQYSIVEKLLNPDSNDIVVLIEILKALIIMKPENMNLLCKLAISEFYYNNNKILAYQILDNHDDLDVLRTYIRLLSKDDENNFDSQYKSLKLREKLFNKLPVGTPEWYSLIESMILNKKEMKMNTEKIFANELLGLYPNDPKIRLILCLNIYSLLPDFQNKRTVLTLISPIVDGELFLEEVHLISECISLYNNSKNAIKNLIHA